MSHMREIITCRPGPRRLLVICGLLAACAPGLAAQSGEQRPRQPKTDTAGLLAINRDYFDLAAATGGDFYFWGPGEFAAAKLEVPNRGEDVVLAYGQVDASPKIFAFPVEPGVRELIVFCGAQRKDLAVLIRPDGTTVRDGDEGSKIQSYRFMMIASIRSPAPGPWKLELHGAGTHAVSVRVAPGKDAPSLNRFAFVEVRGRPGHEGAFEIERALIGGERVSCQAEVSGVSGEVTFTLVDIDGRPLGSPALERSDDGYVGTCDVPSVPFRVVASGHDASGARFRRITSSLTSPEVKAR